MLLFDHLSHDLFEWTIASCVLYAMHSTDMSGRFISVAGG